MGVVITNIERRRCYRAVNAYKYLIHRVNLNFIYDNSLIPATSWVSICPYVLTLIPMVSVVFELV